MVVPCERLTHKWCVKFNAAKWVSYILHLNVNQLPLHRLAKRWIALDVLLLLTVLGRTHSVKLFRRVPSGSSVQLGKFEYVQAGWGVHFCRNHHWAEATWNTLPPYCGIKALQPCLHSNNMNQGGSGFNLHKRLQEFVCRQMEEQTKGCWKSPLE